MNRDIPRPTLRGPGSTAEGGRVAETVAGGLERGAFEFAGSGARPQEVGRLTVRLPAGASQADVARALREALGGQKRGKP